MSVVYKEVKEKDHIIEEMRAELDSIEGERTEALEKIQELNDRLDIALSQKEESEYELQQLKEAMESITGALAGTAEESPKNYDLGEE